MKVNIGKYGRISRKVKVELIGSDIYSLDHTLAYIILPSLLWLKENKVGIPGELAEVGGEEYRSQYSFDFYTATHDEAFDIACKRWEDILDKIIWSFQQIVEEDYNENYHYGELANYDFEEEDEQLVNPLTNKKEKLFRMVDKNPDSHWYDVVGHHEHEKRIQEGLDLFGKYYRSLWT